jgi:RecT family
MTEIATVPAQVASIETNSAALVLSPERMRSMFQFAEMMARGISTVPKHLQGNPADCLAVTMQATQWGMNPFAVAQKTHVVSGALGYEAQLVNAVVQSSGAIEGRFHYEYKGAGDSLECRVGAVLLGETTIAWGMWLAAKAVTTKNSPLWKVNPQQQLGYLQVKNWARLYAPGAILGVYSADELADIPLQPAAPEAPAIPSELLAASQAAAAKGVAAYAAYWKGITKDERLQLAPAHAENKATAEAADKSRTVEEPKIPKTPAPPPAATNAMAASYDAVMAAMVAAEDAEKLQEAADLIGAVQSPEERANLSAAYHDLMANFNE